MKRTTKILIAIALILCAIGLNAQEKCNIYCHNGTVVKAINDNAVNGHEVHGDLFLGDCDAFTGVIGGACEVLSAPTFDFSQPLPLGKKYFMINAIGQIVKKGVVDEYFIRDLPKDELIFIKIRGYKLKKIIRL